MFRYTFLFISCFALMSHVGWGQQNVTIAPGDDVIDKLATVTDPGSTITFEAGHYKLVPKADIEGDKLKFLDLPGGTTVQGAGGGLDPSNSTILDLGYRFADGIFIQNGGDVTLEGFTIMGTVNETFRITNDSNNNLIRDVWVLKSQDQMLHIKSTVGTVFENCVFGYALSEIIQADDPGETIYRNCDFFACVEQIAIATDGANLLFQNCIFYTGSGIANDIIESNGGVIDIRSSILWDPIEDGSEVTAMNGGINVDPVSLDESVIGEDPQYVVAPTFGVPFGDFNLHLQEGSAALTAGSENFEDSFPFNPTGPETYAGSQGIAVAIPDWMIH